jgi:hypothetical protein
VDIASRHETFLDDGDMTFIPALLSQGLLEFGAIRAFAGLDLGMLGDELPRPAIEVGHDDLASGRRGRGRTGPVRREIESRELGGPRVIKSGRRGAGRRAVASFTPSGCLSRANVSRR